MLRVWRSRWERVTPRNLWCHRSPHAQKWLCLFVPVRRAHKRAVRLLISHSKFELTGRHLRVCFAYECVIIGFSECDWQFHVEPLGRTIGNAVFSPVFIGRRARNKMCYECVKGLLRSTITEHNIYDYVCLFYININEYI